MNELPDVARQVKQKILHNFFWKIRKPMMVQKRRDIEILCKNTDYKSLYNECDLNTYEYFKLGLEVHGETCPLPPKEIHSED